MKNIYIILSIFISSFIFSGCSGTMGDVVVPTSTEKHTGLKYEILKHGDGDYVIFPNILADKAGYVKYSRINSGFKRKNAEAAKIKREVFYGLLNGIAQGTRKMGYNYFVLTNIEVNGFAGFPINNFNDFMRYITLEDRIKTFDTIGEGSMNYRSIVNAQGDVVLRFMPVSAKVYNSGVYAVWKVSDFR